MKHIKDSQTNSLTESTLSSMRAPRRRPLPARLAVVLVSCNFFNSLFTLETDQPLVGNSRISLLAPYFLNLHKFSIKGTLRRRIAYIFLVHLESIYYEIFFYSKIVPNCAVAK